MSSVPILQGIINRISPRLLEAAKEKPEDWGLSKDPCPHCGCFFAVAEGIHGHCGYIECSRQCDQCARDQAGEFHEAMSKGRY